MTFDATLRLDPFIGRSFGAYRLTERIADVRVGAAFLGEHRHLERRVVVKLFQPAPAGTAGGGLPRVEARLRALSRGRHEGVLPLVDVGEGDDGLVFVVLELEDHVPLATFVLRGQAALPWRQARVLGRRIAAAMRWAEGQGLAPAALGPGQIFVGPGGVGGREPRARIDLITAEALGLREAPAPVDSVLTVGRVLYLLLTGHVPAAASGGEAPPDPVLSRPELEIPADADALVMRALDPDASKRWPDLGSLHRALGGRDDDAVGTTSSATVGETWFAAAEPAAPTAGVPASATAAAAGHAADAFDERDFDRFGGPGAEFGSDADADFDSTEGSFGSRSFFVRPSRRALISASVAGCAGLALLAIVVGTRHDGVEREPPPPEPVAAQSPGPPGPAPSRDTPDGAGGPVGALDAAPPSGTPGGAVAVGAPEDAAAPAPGPSPAAPVGAAEPGTAEAPAPPAAGPKTPAPRAPGAPPAGAPTEADRPTAGDPGGGRTPGAAPTAGAAPAGAPAGAGTVSPSTRCAVSLGSKPWADLWIDGRRVGFTPVSDLAVACGTHEVVFTSTERGLERRISLTVRPGETVKQVVDLEASPPTTGGEPGAAPPLPPVIGRAPRPECRLSLGSRPWAEVWIDGRRSGVTPIVSLVVRCGKHDLLFLSREANVEHRETITVPEGQHVKKVVTLVEGE